MFGETLATRRAPISVSDRTIGHEARWPAALLLGLSLGGVFLAGLGAQMYLVYDRAAVFAGLAGLFAGILLLSRRTMLPGRLTRLSLSWIAFLGWALVSVVLSGRVWSALVGEVTSELGWATLVALTLVALASAALSPRCAASWLYRAGTWYSSSARSWRISSRSWPATIFPCPFCPAELSRIQRIWVSSSSCFCRGLPSG